MVQRQLMGLMAALLFTGAMPVSSIAQETTGEQKKAEIPQLCRNLQPQFTLAGHLSPVNAIAVSADSKILVSGDENGVVNVWSLETGQLLHSLPAYPGTVRAVAITPDSKSIVSLVNGDEKNSVVSVWNLETGQLIRNFEAGSGEGKALAISPDSKSIVSVMQAKRTGETDEKDKLDVKVWSFQTGELIQSSTQEQGVAQTLDSLNILSLIRVSEVGEGYSPVVNIEFLNRNTGNIIQPASPTANQERYTERDPSSEQDSSKKIAATVSVLGLNKDISFVTLQDSTTQKSLCTVPKSGQVRNIIFSPDSQKLIVAGQRIEVMALNSIPVKLVRSEQQAKIQHLNRLGLDKLKRKQYYSAAQHFWKVFELNRLLGDEQGQIDALYNIAEAKYDLCQVGFNSCRTDYKGLYELLLPYFQSRGDRTRSNISFSRINSQEKERRSEAIQPYQEALEKYRLLNNRKAEADTLVKIALIDRHRSDRESLLKQALKLYSAVRDRRGELEVLHALGLSYSRMLQDKNYKPIGIRTIQAVTHLQAAAKLSREIGDRFLESSILLDLGDVYRWGRKYSQALTSYQLSLDIRRSLGDDTGEDILLYRIAQTLRSLGQYQLALETYQKTLAVCQSKERKCLEEGREYQLTGIGTSIFQEIGEIYFTLKQYSEALNYFQQKMGYSWGWGWDDNKNLGITYEKLGNIDLALKYFGKILSDRGPGCGDSDVADATIVEAIRQDVVIGNDGSECQGYRETWIPSLSIATFHTAEIYRRRGQYNQAIEMYEKSLSRFGRRAAILNNLGTLYKSQGNYKKALEVYQEALWLRRRGGIYRERDSCGEAVSLNNIGEAYRRQGQYSKSLETYQQSLAIFRNLINSFTAAQSKITAFQDANTARQGEASVLHNFGSVYYDLGQYGKALDFYNQSLAISKTLEDKAAQGRSLSNIGLVYEAQKQYPKALEVYQQALTVRREADDRPGEAATLNNIGLVHTKMNQPSQGVEPLQQALSIFQKLEDKASEANTLDSLGTLYATLGQYSQASDAYQNALRLVREANLPPLEGVILSNLGNLLVKTNQPELAIVFYKQSVNIRETIRQDLRQLPRESRESYTQSVAGTYRSLADLLIQQGRLPEAQAVLELLKLRELREFTRDAGIDSPGINLAKVETTALKAILDRFTTLGNFTQRLANCQRTNCADLKTFETQRDTLNEVVNAELKQQRAVLAKYFSTESATLTPEKLNAEARRIVNAQPGTVLIYPLVLKDKIQFLLALKAGDGAVAFRPIEVPNVSAETLFKTIQTFREQLQSPGDLKALQDTSKQLYEWLIKPLASEIPPDKVQHLVFAPDSTIRYIPLAALYDGKQYLIERYSVSTITAASQTNTTETFASLPVNATFLLAMGASTFPNLAPLKNVPAELSAIVKASNVKDTHGIYPGSEFLNLKFDYEALKDHLKNKYRILHIATHGKFKPGRPEDSYLVPGRGDPLTTDRIDQLLNYGISNVHLVVLSACETAVGDRASDGIEIPGISYFFLKNDVKAVLASLWSVNDASTALMMQQFYTQLATGKRTKAEALQTVQREFIKGKLTAKDAPARSDVIPQTTAPSRASAATDFTHPYYWAPFILIGNSL